MTKTAPSETGMAAKANWEAALRGDRAAFQAIVTPHLKELFEAARRELQYRVAIGDLSPDDLTPEELAGEVLIRAWQDRHRRPPGVGTRAWLLALLFRVVVDIVRREARFRNLAKVSLEARVPAEPVYDDDESFWEWYQPDEMTRWEDVVQDRSSMTPEQAAAAAEAFTRLLDPRARHVFLLAEVYRVPLPKAAMALGLSVPEAARWLADAVREVKPEGKGQTE
ncbi:RNA polymerase sigma factor [Azospirillum brasilense]|uniref:RNA polymerase sigma factor n=1 Tax=Azospirillum brasilense TaxID=192 RepID=UPI001EDB1DDC|nr:sigma factor [Azospirillum brasilense]UKJ76499.1 RNA polymerase subunit sigma-70 [Azospirillum brasilense]